MLRKQYVIAPTLTPPIVESIAPTLAPLTAAAARLATVTFPNSRRVYMGSSLQGNAKATTAPPDGRPDLAPPAAMTTYCLPFTKYVLGVALPPNGSFASQRMR